MSSVGRVRMSSPNPCACPDSDEPTNGDMFAQRAESSQSGMSGRISTIHIFVGIWLNRTTLMFSGITPTFRGSDTAPNHQRVRALHLCN